MYVYVINNQECIIFLEMNGHKTFLKSKEIIIIAQAGKWLTTGRYIVGLGVTADFHFFVLEAAVQYAYIL